MSGSLLFSLLVGHALCDYPLQGSFLAKAKSHRDGVPGFPWYQALTAHALIHAGMVAFLTGSIWLGLAEFAIHAATDYLKSEGRIGVNEDQAIHVAAKVLWTVLA